MICYWHYCYQKKLSPIDSEFLPDRRVLRKLRRLVLARALMRVVVARLLVFQVKVVKKVKTPMQMVVPTAKRRRMSLVRTVLRDTARKSRERSRTNLRTQ